MHRKLLLFALLTVWGISYANAQVVEAIPLDTLGKKVVTDFIFEGNKLTQERIILREITFGVGDSLHWSNLKAGMAQSRNNLMNTRLFNTVNIEPVQINNDEVIVLITVQERWYIYPVPILEIAQTNFNTWWETKELRWLNYGVAVSHGNFRGLNQKLSLVLRFGYTKRFSASYTLPNLNKKQTLGLTLSAGYYENEEIVYNTLDNTRQFYRNPEEKARRYMQYKAGLSYRENIFTRHYFELGFFQVSVADSVPILQPEYLVGGVSQARFLRAIYAVDYDTRDYQRYPLKGLLLYGAIQQDGLGIINKENMNLFTTTFSYRHHYQLGKRTYYAYGFTGKVNWSTPPYYLTQGLGYGNFVRGYEFYVIDGTRYGLFQNNFKVALLQNRAISIPFVPSKKFSETFIALYGNVFFDAGIVYGADFESTNSLVNNAMYSIGLGLDLVTYYDKVVRMEGSLNALGGVAVNFHFKQSF
jgi:outer membrane protein assembly factor BamA